MGALLRTARSTSHMWNAVVLLLDIMHQQSEKIGDLIKRLIVECGEVLSLVALPVLFILVALVE